MKFQFELIEHTIGFVRLISKLTTIRAAQESNSFYYPLLPLGHGASQTNKKIERDKFIDRYFNVVSNGTKLTNEL